MKLVTPIIILWNQIPSYYGQFRTYLAKPFPPPYIHHSGSRCTGRHRHTGRCPGYSSPPRRTSLWPHDNSLHGKKKIKKRKKTINAV